MRIGGYSSFYIDNAHVRVTHRGRVTQAQPTAVEQPNGAEAPAGAASTSNLGLDNTATSTVVAAVGPAAFVPAIFASTSGLGLTTTGTPSVLQSTEEVNATPTSISTFEPVWIGSTAQAPMGGTYDGSNGTGTLTFRVDQAGTHGSDDLKIKVYDPNDTFLENINLLKNDPIDTEYTLYNGFVLTLGAEDLLETDSFTLTFNDTIGSAVDPSQPFNGSGNDSPNLQAGFSVTAGSVDVNGETISVNANDTISAVLERITNSSARVTASFDVATESVVLTQNTGGPAPSIVLANDSSGFLASAQLDGITPVPGIDAEADTPLAQVQRLTTVLNQAESDLKTQIRTTGLFVDVLA